MDHRQAIRLQTSGENAALAQRSIDRASDLNANTLYQLQENLIIAALRRPALDAVDGSSTGTRVPWMWEPLKLP
jgi:hypothetical protein